MLQGKKVIAIGDRDGIPGPAIQAVCESAGGEVIFASTACFVWTAAGAMDLEVQQRVKDLAEKHGAENIVVVLGGAEAEASGLTAETVVLGDPTYAGPLAGIALNLDVYHVVESEIKDQSDAGVYDEQCGMMEMVLDVEEIIKEVKAIREQRQ